MDKFQEKFKTNERNGGSTYQSRFENIDVLQNKRKNHIPSANQLLNLSLNEILENLLAGLHAKKYYTWLGSNLLFLSPLNPLTFENDLKSIKAFYFRKIPCENYPHIFSLTDFVFRNATGSHKLCSHFYAKELSYSSETFCVKKGISSLNKNFAGKITSTLEVRNSTEMMPNFLTQSYNDQSIIFLGNLGSLKSMTKNFSLLYLSWVIIQEEKKLVQQSPQYYFSSSDCILGEKELDNIALQRYSEFENDLLIIDQLLKVFGNTSSDEIRNQKMCYVRKDCVKVNKFNSWQEGGILNSLGIEVPLFNTLPVTKGHCEGGFQIFRILKNCGVFNGNEEIEFEENWSSIFSEENIQKPFHIEGYLKSMISFLSPKEHVKFITSALSLLGFDTNSQLNFWKTLFCIQLIKELDFSWLDKESDYEKTKAFKQEAFDRLTWKILETLGFDKINQELSVRKPTFFQRNQLSSVFFPKRERKRIPCCTVSLIDCFEFVPYKADGLSEFCMNLAFEKFHCLAYESSISQDSDLLRRLKLEPPPVKNYKSEYENCLEGFLELPVSPTIKFTCKNTKCHISIFELFSEATNKQIVSVSRDEWLSNQIESVFPCKKMFSKSDTSKIDSEKGISEQKRILGQVAAPVKQIAPTFKIQHHVCKVLYSSANFTLLDREYLNEELNQFVKLSPIFKSLDNKKLKFIALEADHGYQVELNGESIVTLRHELDGEIIKIFSFTEIFDALKMNKESRWSSFSTKFKETINKIADEVSKSSCWSVRSFIQSEICDYLGSIPSSTMEKNVFGLDKVITNFNAGYPFRLSQQEVRFIVEAAFPDLNSLSEINNPVQWINQLKSVLRADEKEIFLDKLIVYFRRRIISKVKKEFEVRMESKCKQVDTVLSFKKKILGAFQVVWFVTVLKEDRDLKSESINKIYKASLHRSAIRIQIWWRGHLLCIVMIGTIITLGLKRIIGITTIGI